MGIELIASNNGWAMALVGACIVFTGLVVLSFAISRLKVLFGWIEKEAASIDEVQAVPLQPDVFGKDGFLLDIQQAAEVYDPMVRGLGETFALTALYSLAREHNLPHPHITISGLREAGILMSCGEGSFRWDLAG